MKTKLLYVLFFVGCLAHAKFLSLVLAQYFWTNRLGDSWYELLYLVFWISIIVWPVWAILIWKYGPKENRAFAIVVPVVVGGIFMWPVPAWVLFIVSAHVWGIGC